jgi:hypothetical protein
MYELKSIIFSLYYGRDVKREALKGVLLACAVLNTRKSERRLMLRAEG